eukprot:m.365208 g.365208  ORF g.365208 m.365208 type:complete len:1889 (-) comp28082_c0_seq5:432-6098(-)
MSRSRAAVGRTGGVAFLCLVAAGFAAQATAAALNCYDIILTGDRSGGPKRMFNGQTVHCAAPNFHGGGWMLMTAAAQALLPLVSRYEYMYSTTTHGGNRNDNPTRWYIGPETTVRWSWSAAIQVTGTYRSSRGDNHCPGSGERPEIGVGCSTGPGRQRKVMPMASGRIPSQGRARICQDVPDAFHVSTCTPTTAEIFWRPALSVRTSGPTRAPTRSPTRSPTLAPTCGDLMSSCPSAAAMALCSLPDILRNCMGSCGACPVLVSPAPSAAPSLTLVRQCGTRVQERFPVASLVPDVNGFVALPSGFPQLLGSQYAYCDDKIYQMRTAGIALANLFLEEMDILDDIIAFETPVVVNGTQRVLRSIRLNTDGALHSIDRFAFIACSRLTNIAIPYSVVHIGNGAFAGCSRLTSVVFGDQPSPFSGLGLGFPLTIQDSAFGILDDNTVGRDRIAVLTLVMAPGIMESLRGCIVLNNVFLPARTQLVASRAFQNASSLATIAIPSAARVTRNAFEGTFCAQTCDPSQPCQLPTNGSYTGANCITRGYGPRAPFELRINGTGGPPPTVVELGSEFWISPPMDIPNVVLFEGVCVPPSVPEPQSAIRYDLSIPNGQVGRGGSVTLNSTSGRVDFIPTTLGNYTLIFGIEDWCGRTVEVATWDFTVVPRPPLVRTNLQPPFFPPLGPQIAVNETFRTSATFNLSALFTGIDGAITLTLVSDHVTRRDVSDQTSSLPPGAVLFSIVDDVNALQTLTLTAFPTTTENFSVAFVATDAAGRSETALDWTFEVLPLDTSVATFGPNGEECLNGGVAVDGIEFDQNFTCSCEGLVFVGDNCNVSAAPQLLLDTSFSQRLRPGTAATLFSFYNRTKWGWGRSYTLAPFDLRRAFTVEDANLTAQVTYTLVWTGPTSQPGFLTDGSTGEILARIPSHSASFDARLTIDVPNTVPAVAANLTFTFLPEDINPQSTAVGPNRADCSNDGVRSDTFDGESEFDGFYTCQCTEGFGGPNCFTNIADAATAEQAKDTRAATTAGVTVAVILLVLLVLSLIWAFRLRHRPEDMAKIQKEILGLVGNGAILRLKAHELGFVLTFAPSMAVAASSSDSDAEQDSERYAASVIASLRQLPKLPRQLSQLLQDRAMPSVTVIAADGVGLLRLQRPRGKPVDAERFASALNDCAQNQLVSAGDGAHHVINVAVAMGVKVPRELDRQTVVRLGPLGHGRFAEVFKASLRERSKIALMVALKTAKDSSSRAEILREGALMALFDHRNIIHLVGVITAPRHMPAVLALELCDKGTLLEVARRADVGVSTLLTYCHDVGCGLHYLALRKVLHRDVAARNVLVDAENTAKLSDFGMSVALLGSGSGTRDSEYSDLYVRLHGEQAVRWAAVEVITEEKFSRGSDVWALGVLMYEVMGGGLVPYGEIRSTKEVMEHVKAGNILGCPLGCHIAVYQQAMIPCWNRDPYLRPTYTAFCETLVDLGATPTDPTTDINRDELPPIRNGSKKQLFMGPTVHYISTKLRPRTLAAVAKPWTDRNGNHLDNPETATIAHAVAAVVKPATKNVTCPQDHKKGCSLVDALNLDRDQNPDDVGYADALLSYTWGYRIVAVASALDLWVATSGRKPKETSVWVCSLCLNQHRMESTVTSEELAETFGSRVRSIGRVLPLLEPWSDPVYLTRAWCLFELYTALANRGRVEVTIIFTKESQTAFRRAMCGGGYAKIDAALDNIKSETATASVPQDQEAIRKLIQATPGGFEVLNTRVRQHLKQWFVEQGAIHTVQPSLSTVNSQPPQHRRRYRFGSINRVSPKKQSMSVEDQRDPFQSSTPPPAPMARMISVDSTSTPLPRHPSTYKMAVGPPSPPAALPDPGVQAKIGPHTETSPDGIGTPRSSVAAAANNN